MRREVSRDLSDSARCFKALVWPVIAAWCGGGELVPMEGVADSAFAKRVDTLSGVDAWQLCAHPGGMRGIASRVQFGRPWPSFTLRERRSTGAETEIAKRLRCMAEPKRRWLLPALTVQGYVSAREGGRLLYVAVCFTEELLGLVRNGSPGVDFTRNCNPADGNGFVVVWVRRMQALGLTVREFDARDGLSPVEAA